MSQCTRAVGGSWLCCLLFWWVADEEPHLRAAVHWVDILILVQQPLFDPPRDYPAALAFGLAGTIFLHDRPGCPFRGGAVVCIAVSVRHPFVDVVENLFDCLGWRVLMGLRVLPCRRHAHVVAIRQSDAFALEPVGLLSRWS